MKLLKVAAALLCVCGTIVAQIPVPLGSNTQLTADRIAQALGYVPGPVGGAGASGPQYKITGFTGTPTGGNALIGYTNSYTDGTGNPLTVPGALTGQSVNGVANAFMYQSGGGNNGIANAVGTVGVNFILAPPNYAATEVVGFPNAAQTILDQRQGAAYWGHNLAGTAPFSTNCLVDAATSGFWYQNVHCNDSNMYVLGPGNGLGNGNVFNTSGSVHSVTSFAAGITGGDLQIINGFSSNDVNPYCYLQSVMGADVGSAEGFEGCGTMHMLEPNMFMATSTSTGTGLAQISTTPTSAVTQFMTHGNGQYTRGPLIDLTQIIESGTITAISAGTFPTPNEITTGTAHTASTVYGKTTTVTPDPGNRPIGSTETFTVSNTLGTFPTGGSEVCIKGPSYIEQSFMTATSPSGGTQNLTGILRYPHQSNAFVVMMAAGTGSCDLMTLNALTIAGVNDVGYYIIGARDTTHYWYAFYASNGSTNVMIDGSNPAGTTAGINGYKLYPFAEVVNVLNPARVGTAAYYIDPLFAVDGTLTLAHNSMTIISGDSLEQPHKPASKMTGTYRNFVGNTPSQINDSSSVDAQDLTGLLFTGTFQLGSYRFDNPLANFKGFGGTWIPNFALYRSPGAVYQDFFNVPAPIAGGSFTHLGCPNEGCTSTAEYALAILEGANNHASYLFRPSDQRVHFSAPGGVLLDGNVIVSALTPGTAPVCPNGTNGALTQTGCAAGGGTGTVTHTAGPLTALAPMLGNGTADSKVDSGASSDGAGTFNFVGVKIAGSQALTSVLGTTGTKTCAFLGTLTANHLISADVNSNCVDSGVAFYISTAATLTGGPGVSSVTCASATCTSSRGTLTIVGGTATMGRIATLTYTATPSAQVCTATQNGGTSFLGIGNSIATTTSFDINAGVTVNGVTLTVNYSCNP